MTTAYLTFLAAILLSGIAAYYSVIGLASIFVGAFWPVVFMGSSLEFAKVVTTSWLYKNWKNCPMLLKVYLTCAVVTLMIITSMGIFGYLSKSHLEQSTMIAPLVEKVTVYEEKIKVIQSQIDRNNKNLSQYDEAVDQIMGRSKDERGAERANQIRKAQQKDRERIIAETKGYQKEIQTLTEEKLPLSLEVGKAESELGPIKYVAELIYGSSERDIIDKAVRLVIILIMLVFDPLAVLLLIAGNMTLEQVEKKKKGPLDIFKDRVEERITNLKNKPEVADESVKIDKQNITEIQEDEDDILPEGLVKLFQDGLARKKEANSTDTKTIIEPKYDYDDAFAFREKSKEYEIPTLREKK
jgi:hypothetical protein